MGDLLIAAAIDLGEGNWFGEGREGLVRGFALGKAGDIAVDEPPGALFVRRAYGRPPYTAKPRTRAMPAAYGEGFGHVLLAGRLMDRTELAATHGLDPALDDAALYGAIYAKRGDQCDDALIGDYAVIQWFPRERRVRLARSPLSQQPLHLWHDGDRLVAASIPRMIHSVAAIPRVLDRRHAEDTLVINLRADRRSWFENIERVPAGSTLVIEPNRRSARRYWSVNTVPPVRFARDEGYVEAVEDAFRRATRATLEGVAQPGVTLSGGLDSQAVTSFLLDEAVTDARLPTWTAVPHRNFSQSSDARVFPDEGPNVRALAAMHPRLDPHFVTGFYATFGERLDAMFVLGDCPTHNEFNMHWAHEIAAQAAQAGCDTLIGGDGGNMTFSYDGMTGYPTWLREGRWRRLLREVRAMPDGRPLWRRLFSRAVMPNLPLAWRMAFDQRRPHWYPSPFATWCPMRGQYAADAGVIERVLAEGHDPTFHPLRSARDWRAGLVAAFSNEGPEIELGSTLVHGIPYRDPTLYRPFVELTFGMPDEQFLRDGQKRWLARRLLKGRVPEQVRLERRAGLQAADWPLRFMRDRPAILSEMQQLAEEPDIAEMIDLGRLSQSLTEWDGSDRIEDRLSYALQVSVSRGLTTARFMRFAEGRNRG